jgi:(p)ppGpp synthase/HD superfamily hydrolase
MMIFRAIEFATKAHAGQYRKGTKIPYIIHPLAVAKILIEYGGPEHVVIAGILHDTIEDTPVTADQIKGVFGCHVANLVVAVSEPDKSDTWENRKKHTLTMLKILSEEALLISLADKLDNIGAIQDDLMMHGPDLWKRFKRPREEQRWYYESLAGIFSARLIDAKAYPLAERFQTAVKKVFA